MNTCFLSNLCQTVFLIFTSFVTSFYVCKWCNNVLKKFQFSFFSIETKSLKWNRRSRHWNSRVALTLDKYWETLCLLWRLWARQSDCVFDLPSSHIMTLLQTRFSRLTASSCAASLCTTSARPCARCPGRSPSSWSPPRPPSPAARRRRRPHTQWWVLIIISKNFLGSQNYPK